MQRKLIRNREIRKVHNRVKFAQGLFDEENYSEAKKQLLEIRNWALRAKYPFPHVAWMLSVASDNLQDVGDAVSFIREALAQDPLNSHIQHSYRLIMGRLRNTLASPSWEPEDPRTAEFYNYLLEEDQADSYSHLAMARYLHSVGKTTAALRILHSLTVLSPSFQEGWELRAELAKELGLDEMAERVERDGGLALPEAPQPNQPPASA